MLNSIVHEEKMSVIDIKAKIVGSAVDRER